MLHYIKNIIIYSLIWFFMYVILLRETKTEGFAKKIIKKASDKSKDIGDAGADFAKKQAEDAQRLAIEAAAETQRLAREALAETKRLEAIALAEATRLAKEAADKLSKLLDEAFDKLVLSVSKIDTMFTSADLDITNITNMADNFAKNAANKSKFAEQAKADKAKADWARAMLIKDNIERDKVIEADARARAEAPTS